MALIKCSKCGVKYSDKADMCPCCKEENRQRKELAGREKEKGKTFRKGKEKKEMSTLAFVLFLAVVCVVAFFLARMIMQKRNIGKQEEATENAGKVMEQYLERKQYQELYDYYQGLGGYNDSYEKYWEVGSAWNWMKFMRETKDALEDDSKTYYGISYALSGASKALMIIDEAVTDGEDRGNEEILTGFKDEIMSFLKEDLQLSTEETEVVKGAGKGESPDWDAMEASVLSRLNLTKK